MGLQTQKAYVTLKARDNTARAFSRKVLPIFIPTYEWSSHYQPLPAISIIRVLLNL